ncbi:hypothetical protein QDR37_14355 [Amnibacterium sp. CER49]|uniref:hypothetical protein n=1 Tax=Amnibacterium sp. CER49 TaxID=3039161 RepID=UPI00244D3634|nr:hypothetical protein [Amnibacterium sp. CER49]MDH2445132.1 hypothetical protein [Amnibacterium sp. CER49]
MQEDTTPSIARQAEVRSILQRLREDGAASRLDEFSALIEYLAVASRTIPRDEVDQWIRERIAAFEWLREQEQLEG